MQLKTLPHRNRTCSQKLCGEQHYNDFIGHCSTLPNAFHIALVYSFFSIIICLSVFIAFRSLSTNSVLHSLNSNCLQYKRDWQLQLWKSILRINLQMKVLLKFKTPWNTKYDDLRRNLQLQRDLVPGPMTRLARMENMVPITSYRPKLCT